ncbi:MAG: hypothetical protein QM534_07985 [Sediminibacterium sp.]|nr:hypothetical protein [Sediminibacterium sp.]
MKKAILFLSVLSIAGFVSCKKDNKDPEPSNPTSPAPTPTTGNLTVQFTNMVDAQPLVFNTGYKIMGGDSFKVTKLNYYITNIRITKTDNSVYSETNSYHLVEHSNPSSTSITLPNVPNGSYKSISFTLGVDSALNVSGAQQGDLSPTKGMFWSWNSGYIMFKLEGSSPASGASSKGLLYHVGGFSGANKTQREFAFNFGATTANVNGTSTTPKVKVSTNVTELFRNPNTINFSVLHTVHMPGADAKKLADNYADMFTFDSVVN